MPPRNLFLLTLMALPASGTAKDAPEPRAKLKPILFLQAGEQAPEEMEDDATQSMLYREMLRQSVLLTAREDLGLTTRDASLREASPDGPAESNRLRVRMRSYQTRPSHFTLVRQEGNAAGSASSSTPVAP